EFILKKPAAQFRQVLAPKVAGTLHLDQASRDVELDFFVLFSSFAGAMGNPGQADYAAANGFLDQFAAYRNRQVAAKERHGRTRSINWPLWQDGAMAMDPATRELLRQSTGIQPMQTATGLRAFHRSLALPYDQLLVAEGDLEQLHRALLTGRPIQPELSAPVVTPEAFSGDLIEQARNFLRREFSALLKLPAHKIDSQAALERYGIDSILALKLTSQLEKTFGALSKTLFFEYQTIQELAQYFVQSHAARLATLFPPVAADARPEPAAPVEGRRLTTRRLNPARTIAPSQRPESDPIAIIGLSGRYPEAIDLDAYWRNLRDGKDCIVEVPKERWDWQAYFSDDRSGEGGHHYSKWGGFIAGVDEFDPLFFNISPRDARAIDPQERLFLQHAWLAMEDAGYTRASLQVPHERDLPGQVGVYVGVMYSEYQLFGAESSLQGKRLGIAGSVASIANRVSYVLNLHGPSMTLDTMCSSSLTAIHLACQDLKQGRTTLAIAGGVNVSIHPNKYLVLSAGQFISSDGHCQSFGEGGDGYIPGEGVGAVILKRLSDARRDGDHIYGLIRGSALTHGGKTNGYTVPNPQAQSSAISRALAESHTDARHVSYIEAHGTGTKLGDPIEIAALNKAFQQHTQEAGFCRIGSAKSNIGHCESAAGIAGLTKVLLQMQHQQIVPSLHSAKLNPHIDFDATPFVVNQSLQPWESPVIDGRTLPRIAGISSFGAGGSNAHMIIEEYPAPARQQTAAGPVAIVLSARTADQLRQKAVDLATFVRAHVSSLDLESLTYTLQVGREPMDERLGFVVSSVEQLAEKLQAYVSGQQGIEEAYHGQVKANRDALAVFSDADLQETIDKWIAGRKLSRLLDVWVKGVELDWAKLYGDATPRRMSLPTYPFARERYWIEPAPPVVPVATNAPASAVLHPLLHSNTSDLNQQSYSTTFRADDVLLKDPASAYLEMARAAVENATRGSHETVVELRNVVWAKPVDVAGKKQVGIALLPAGDDAIDFEIYAQDADDSQVTNEEMVLCQGRAILGRRSPLAALDLEQLARSGQLLAQLRLPATQEPSVADFVLHPGLISGALQAATTLIGARPSFGLETLCIAARCNSEMVAWVRYASGSQAGDAVVNLDVDLCDAGGNVAVQMRGIRWREAAVEIVEIAELAAPPKEIALAARVPREIAFVVGKQAKSAPVEQKARLGVSLASPRSSEGKTRQSAAGRSPITLSSAKRGAPDLHGEGTEASAVRLYDWSDGIFGITISGPDAGSHLLQALERMQRDASVKVLMLAGIEHAFAGGGRKAYNEAIEQKLYDALVSFPYPVIAVLQGGAIGAGFLAAALCDFMVCNEEARYGYTDVESQLVPTTAVEVLFGARFGDVRAQDLLYRSTTSTGSQLRAKGWTCPILPQAQVEAYAQQLASTLATKSQEALRLLKQHLTRNVAGLVSGLTRVDVAAPEAGTIAGAIVAPERIRLETPADRVLAITIGAGGAQNLNADLAQIFAAIRKDAHYKAVVLASDDPEFLSGAIPEDVVLDVQRLLLESDIPVVAALAGNASGNAWLLAQSCDACVYSAAGIYAAADLSPAFAQTAAAVFADRFGNEAASEILMTAAGYTGRELQQRVGALSVTERDRVLTSAVDVAAHWTRLPRPTLAGWKTHTASTLRQKIAGMPAAAQWERSDDTLANASAAPVAIPLQSTVVTATAQPDGVVVVTMQDRDAKNMFSDAFMQGVTEAFARIAQLPSCKVVVLTGYDTYFASGGTKESLLAVQQGKAKFTDFNIQLALECKVPVIAAMQGHAIGAGWPLGMFADVVLLSEESRYLSPYMNYGFTPGAGATYILGEKIGADLARESLLTAEPYG
ncbi:MAG: hypothetical protein JWO56_191, partial [Acidobacteria bacterium]|nr:hypothetical protein [Acidobacteriota bacterium]